MYVYVCKYIYIHMYTSHMYVYIYISCMIHIANTWYGIFPRTNILNDTSIPHTQYIHTMVNLRYLANNKSNSWPVLCH